MLAGHPLTQDAATSTAFKTLKVGTVHLRRCLTQVETVAFDLYMLCYPPPHGQVIHSVEPWSCASQGQSYETLEAAPRLAILDALLHIAADSEALRSHIQRTTPAEVTARSMRDGTQSRRRKLPGLLNQEQHAAGVSPAASAGGAQPEKSFR